MEEVLILAILLLMLVFGSLSQGAADRCDQWARVSWTGIGAGLVLALCAPNPFATILIGLVSINLFWHPPMSETWKKKLAPGLVLIGTYVLVSPKMQLWMVPWMLTGIASIGAVTGLWAIYSACQSKLGDTGFVHEYANGWLRIVDRSGMAPLAGQGNFNHTQSVGALSVAASLGLAEWWALPLGVLSLTAVLLSTEGRMTGQWVSQGLIHLSAITLLFIAASVNSVSGWLALAMIGCALLLWAHPWKPRTDKWYDSHRFAMWNMALRKIWWTANQPPEPEKMLLPLKEERAKMLEVQEQAARDGNAAVHNAMTLSLQQNAEQTSRMEALATPEPLRSTEQRGICRMFWCQRIRVRLIGCGTGTWYPLMKWPTLLSTGAENPVTKQWEGMVYLHAHNEWVEALFEFGVLGLLAVGGLASYALTTTIGTPVFLSVVALISISLLNFPLTLFADVEQNPNAPPMAPQYVGCPALTVMSLVVFLLVEAVR